MSKMKIRDFGKRLIGNLPSVVFLAPDFHGSGVTIFANLASHFSQTMFVI